MKIDRNAKYSYFIKIKRLSVNVVDKFPIKFHYSRKNYVNWHNMLPTYDFHEIRLKYKLIK